jgi:hypothetical protein
MVIFRYSNSGVRTRVTFILIVFYASRLWSSPIDSTQASYTPTLEIISVNNRNFEYFQVIANDKKEKPVPVWNYRFSAGLGTANTMYWLLDFGQQYGEFTLNKNRNVFFKAEKMLTYRSGLAINYAQAGVDVNASLKTDSFFNTELQKLVPTEVTIKYRTQSVNLRYNLHFAPSEKFDPYIGISMGIRFNSIDGSVNNPVKGFSDFDLTIPFLGFTTPGGDLTLGCAGKIAGGLGYYTEIGIAKALIQGGINITLKKKTTKSKFKPIGTPEF